MHILLAALLLSSLLWSGRASAQSKPDEACAQLILVAYKGADHAAADIKRSKADAAKRAEQLAAKLAAGADFGALAKAESDAKSSAAREGCIGTFTKSEWPALHAQIRDAVFALTVGATAPQSISADYGFALVRRCPVEKAHSRHILVRYRGAKNAGAEITRSKAEAATRAKQLLAKLQAGEDFASLARSDSDDSSKERGGDIGLRGRGLLAVAYEKALFALKPGARSPIVESEFGFHIIERLPDGN